MATDTIVVDELLTPPFYLRAWWTNGNLRYDIAMSSIIIILNSAAMLYMRAHKISLSEELLPSLVFLVPSYFIFFLVGFLFWVLPVYEEDFSFSEPEYFVGRISHTLGVCILLCLLYSISPHQSTIYLGLPCFLWFVPVMIVPFCPCGKQAWCDFAKNQQPSVR